MRTYDPVALVAYRERKPGEVLPPQLDRQGGPRPGEQRCGAVGLMRGDCDQSAPLGAIYCYYHEKLRSGLIEPSAPIYPVWPFPANGYIVVRDERQVA